MRVRHMCAKVMSRRAERAERTMADFVGVASEEGEIDHCCGRCLADNEFGLISAQDMR